MVAELSNTGSRVGFRESYIFHVYSSRSSRSLACMHATMQLHGASTDRAADLCRESRGSAANIGLTRWICSPDPPAPPSLPGPPGSPSVTRQPIPPAARSPEPSVQAPGHSRAVEGVPRCKSGAYRSSSAPTRLGVAGSDDCSCACVQGNAARDALSLIHCRRPIDHAAAMKRRAREI